MTRALLLAAGLVVGLSALVGCSGGIEAAAPPPPLPEAAVPASLAVDQGVVLQPNTSQDTANAFASPGRKSLVVDVRVWELRKADRLVGALQVSTLDSRRIDTARREDRAALRSQILSGAQAELEVAATPVWSTKDGDRIVDVWFGRQVLCVLQVKADDLDAEEALNELLTAMVDHPTWPGLAPEVFEEEQEGDA